MDAVMNARDMNADTTDRIRVVETNATDDDRLWATFIHLSGLAGYVLPTASIFAPLILWLVKKSQSPFLDDHGREAVNFQLSMLLWGLVAAVLCLVCVGMLLVPVLFVVHIAFSIMMAIRANRGEYVRYPITIRFLS